MSLLFTVLAVLWRRSHFPYSWSEISCWYLLHEGPRGRLSRCCRGVSATDTRHPALRGHSGVPHRSRGDRDSQWNVTGYKIFNSPNLLRITLFLFCVCYVISPILRTWCVLYTGSHFLKLVMLSSVLWQKLNVGINIFTFSFNTKLHAGQLKSTFLFSDRDSMKMPIMMCLNVYL